MDVSSKKLILYYYLFCFVWFGNIVVNSPCVNRADGTLGEAEVKGQTLVYSNGGE